MKLKLLKFIYQLSPLFDVFLSILIIPGALMMLYFRRLGAKNYPLTSKVLKRIGVFPIRKHFDEPFFGELSEIHKSLNKKRDLPGIKLRENYQKLNLKKLIFENEFISFVENSKKDNKESSFKIDNNSFAPGDSDFLYQFIRGYQPKRVLEIGCGTSTKIIRQALQKNRQIYNYQTEHICVEPYKASYLDDFKEIKLIRERIELKSSKTKLHKLLSSGDMLFIDSSHIIRPQGPVLYQFLELIPKLKKGVLIHVHDIFTPYDYHPNSVIRDSFFWNEMYLLEALLTDSPKYEILFSLNFLNKNYHNDLKRVCPFLRKNQILGSFYFQTK